eukprot:483756-Pleurochrysis_carterae.AAC.1
MAMRYCGVSHGWYWDIAITSLVGIIGPKQLVHASFVRQGQDNVAGIGRHILVSTHLVSTIRIEKPWRGDFAPAVREHAAWSPLCIICTSTDTEPQARAWWGHEAAASIHGFIKTGHVELSMMNGQDGKSNRPQDDIPWNHLRERLSDRCLLDESEVLRSMFQ